ncbi:MAG: serine/threonine protein kinase [Acidobacteria bacterium]|nr:serine/threonine protein kinase [Acidobacteriota bacterium]
MDEMIGKVIGGRFKIERLIGMGGMGAVYEARHLTLPRTLAIKILRPELTRDRGFTERFRREAIAMSRVQHPNVAYITDFGHTDAGAVYLVMEYLEGVGLDQVLAKTRLLPPGRAVAIMAQIADALDVAHQVNVIHRDLKPENILLTTHRGMEDFVKLLDFGIAKVQTPEFKGAPLTVAGEVFGTAEYMSPEQATGQEVDGRSDIYALGCLMFELLTGDPPFLGSAVEVLKNQVYDEPPSPSSHLPRGAIPPSLDALVMRCLQKKPDDRHPTCGALRTALMRVRAMLFSDNVDQSVRNRLTGRIGLGPNPDQMTSGWQSLGGKVPEMFLPGGGGGDDLREASKTISEGVKRPPEPSPVGQRQAVQDTVRELSFALHRSGLLDEETSGALERLLVVDGQVATLEHSMALGRQETRRLRFEFGQKERALRRAMGALQADMSQLQDTTSDNPAAALAVQDQLDDLRFQIDQLKHRSAEVEREREAEEQEALAELSRMQKEKDALLGESARFITDLALAADRLRGRAHGEELRPLFDALDRARSAG